MLIQRYKTDMSDLWSAIVELHQERIVDESRFLLRQIDTGRAGNTETHIEVFPADTTEAEARSATIAARKTTN